MTGEQAALLNTLRRLRPAGSVPGLWQPAATCAPASSLPWTQQQPAPWGQLWRLSCAHRRGAVAISGADEAGVYDLVAVKFDGAAVQGNVVLDGMGCVCGVPVLDFAVAAYSRALLAQLQQRGGDGSNSSSGGCIRQAGWIMHCTPGANRAQSCSERSLGPGSALGQLGIVQSHRPANIPVCVHDVA